MTDAEGGGTFMWWGISPGSWARHAHQLRRSAEYLWQPIQQLLESAKAAERGEDVRLDLELWNHSYAFLLLAGCALEAMFKAAAIQRGMNTCGFDAVMTPTRELRRWLLTHNLIRLAQRAGLDPVELDQVQLERFTKYIVWAGRYPVQKTLVEQHPDGVLHVDFDVSDHDRVRFDQLFALAEELYMKHRAAAPGDGYADRVTSAT